MDWTLALENTDDEKALLMAAESGDFQSLISLLQRGVCPNFKVLFH